jgi:hypothetical protein
MTAYWEYPVGRQFISCISSAQIRIRILAVHVDAGGKVRLRFKISAIYVRN